MDTLFVVVGGTIAGTVIGGLILGAIWRGLPSVRRLLRRLGRSTWLIVSRPMFQWLGWLAETPYPTDDQWASIDQFNGVQEGGTLVVRAMVHSSPSVWEDEGTHYGWRLDIRVGAERIVCFFPNSYKKSNRRYLRRLKGSQRVVVRGKVTALNDIHSIYKNDWLKPTMNLCHVVGAWKRVDRRQWLRIAGWYEAQTALGSSPASSPWSRLGRWLGRLGQ